MILAIAQESALLEQRRQEALVVAIAAFKQLLSSLKNQKNHFD